MYIYCPATGKPAPLTYSWLHTGKVSFISAPSRIIGGLTTSVFAFKQIGNFTEILCTVSNIAGLDTKTVYIRTLSKPTCICIHTSYRLSVIIICIHVPFSQLSTEPIIRDPPPNWMKTTQLLLVIVHVFLSTVVCVLTVAHTKAILCINGVKMVRLLPIPAHQTF